MPQEGEQNSAFAIVKQTVVENIFAWEVFFFLLTQLFTLKIVSNVQVLTTIETIREIQNPVAKLVRTC